MSDLLDALGDVIVAVPVAAIVVVAVASSSAAVFMLLFNKIGPHLVSAPIVRVSCQETPQNVNVDRPAVEPGQ